MNNNLSLTLSSIISIKKNIHYAITEMGSRIDNQGNFDQYAKAILNINNTTFKIPKSYYQLYKLSNGLSTTLDIGNFKKNFEEITSIDLLGNVENIISSHISSYVAQMILLDASTETISGTIFDGEGKTISGNNDIKYVLLSDGTLLSSNISDKITNCKFNSNGIKYVENLNKYCGFMIKFIDTNFSTNLNDNNFLSPDTVYAYSNNINYSNLTNGIAIFSGKINLKALQFNKDIIKNDLPENLTNLFAGCTSLQTLPDPNIFIYANNITNALSGTRFKYVTYLTDETGLKNDIIYLNPNSMTIIDGLFKNCTQYENPIKIVNSQNISAMNNTFEQCTKLKEVIFDVQTTNCKSMISAFTKTTIEGSNSLQNINFSNCELNNLSSIFQNCINFQYLQNFSCKDSLEKPSEVSIIFGPSKKPNDDKNIYYSNFSNMNNLTGLISGQKDDASVYVSDCTFVFENTARINEFRKTVLPKILEFKNCTFIANGNNFDNFFIKYDANSSDIKVNKIINCTFKGKWFRNFCKGLTTLTQASIILDGNFGYDCQAYYFLSGCTGLKNASITFQNFNNSTLNFYGSFQQCTSLSACPALLGQYEKIKNFENMFLNCSRLSGITFGTETFTTQNITVMNYMFKGCSNLTEINNLDFSSCWRDANYYMFHAYSVDQTPQTLTLNNVRLYQNAARNASWYSLTNALLPNATGNTVKVKINNLIVPASYTSFESMFNGSKQIIGLSGITFEDVYEKDGKLKFQGNNITNVKSMFLNAINLQNIGNLQFPKVRYAESMFNGCTLLSSVTNLSLGQNFDDWQNVKASSLSAGYNLSTPYLFYGCSNLSGISDDLDKSDSLFNNVYLNQLYDGRFLFKNSGIKKVPKCIIESFINSIGQKSLYNLQSAFQNCKSIKKLDNFKIQNPITQRTPFKACGYHTYRLFKGCTSLESISGFQIRSLNFAEAFRGCTALSSINGFTMNGWPCYYYNWWNGWNTVTDFAQHFSNTFYETNLQEIHNITFAPYQSGQQNGGWRNQAHTLHNLWRFFRSLPNTGDGVEIYNLKLYVSSDEQKNLQYADTQCGYYVDMLKGCSSVKLINGFIIDTPATTYNFNSMFQSCSKFKGLSGLIIKNDNAKVNSMNDMFYNCKQDLSLGSDCKFTVTENCSFHQLFRYSGITKFENISNFLVNALKGSTTSDCYCMFADCTSLQSVYGTLDLGNATSISHLFYNCPNMKVTGGNLKYYIKSIQKAYDEKSLSEYSKVSTYITGLISLSSYNNKIYNELTGKITPSSDISSYLSADLFLRNQMNDLSKQLSSGISNLKRMTETIQNLSSQFNLINKLDTINKISSLIIKAKDYNDNKDHLSSNLSSFELSGNYLLSGKLYDNIDQIQEYHFNLIADKATDVTNVFYSCTSFEGPVSISFANATEMHYVLNGSKIKYIDYIYNEKDQSIWTLFRNNVANTLTYVGSAIFKGATNASALFENCSSLISVEYLQLINQNFTNFNYAFKNCVDLQKIGKLQLNASKTLSMQQAFYNCSSLRSIDIEGSYWKNSNNEIVCYIKPNNLYNTFDGCVLLTDIFSKYNAGLDLTYFTSWDARWWIKTTFRNCKCLSGKIFVSKSLVYQKSNGNYLFESDPNTFGQANALHIISNYLEAFSNKLVTDNNKRQIQLKGNFYDYNLSTTIAANDLINKLNEKKLVSDQKNGYHLQIIGS